MGANFQGYVVPGSQNAEFKRVSEWFDRLVDQQQMEHGYDSYSGEFCAKRYGLRQIHGEWTEETAEEHCVDHNEKRGATFAYQLDDGRWWIGGWCPE